MAVVPKIRNTLVVWVFVLGLSACGSSSGGAADVSLESGETIAAGDAIGSAGMIGPSGEMSDEELSGAAGLVQQDELLSCDAVAPFDIAELVLTEADRQWYCEIGSDDGTRYGDVYFSRRGTVQFNAADLRYWNRNLPGEEINLASPSRVPELITDIQANNTSLEFRIVSETGSNETYDCVLISRDVSATL